MRVLSVFDIMAATKCLSSTQAAAFVRLESPSKSENYHLTRSARAHLYIAKDWKGIPPNYVSKEQ